MSWMNKTMHGAMPNQEIDSQMDPAPDPVLEQALANFRQSVHAWSEAACNRPRVEMRTAHGGWRLAVVWAMGCVLVAGGFSGGLYERHRHEVMARLAQQAREAQQRELAAQQRAADEDLLATVDSDISRDVPAAMEPLANLMDQQGTNQQ
jgi:hypothetical protein